MGYPFVQFYKVPPSYYNYFKLGSAQSMRNSTVCLKNIHACMYLTHTNFGCIPEIHPHQSHNFHVFCEAL